jgi:hypothetical protein
MVEDGSIHPENQGLGSESLPQLALSLTAWPQAPVKACDNPLAFQGEQDQNSGN